MEMIDIFAGMGTARMAFEAEGWKCNYSIEWDNKKRKLYKEIFGYEPEWSDIKTVRGTDIPRSDCWVFGFPCQDISITGNQSGLKGERSGLFCEVIKKLEQKQETDRPEWLLAENVDNFIRINDGWDMFTAITEMARMGYDVEWQVLDGKDFGAAGRRVRVFIVGHHRAYGERRIFPFLEQSRTSCRQLNPGIGHSSYRVYSTKGIARTLKAKCGGMHAKTGMYLMPDGRARGLTPRECFRVQTVPEEIIDRILSTTTLSREQLRTAAGDSMTVNVVRRIAKAMAEQWG